MQSTTRWCLNEGSMSNRMCDQNGVFHKEHKPPLVPNQPSKFTSQCVTTGGEGGFESALERAFNHSTT
jgi:hypothetical protein